MVERNITLSEFIYPESLGGNFAAAPTATSWAAGRLDVFGTGADNALYHNYWDGNWHGWNDRID